jgi:hypothetical protein
MLIKLANLRPATKIDSNGAFAAEADATEKKQRSHYANAPTERDTGVSNSAR